MTRVNAADLGTPSGLLSALIDLRRDVYLEGRGIYARWESSILRRSFRPCALNLAHYLALRRRDLRPVQDALTPWGLSSLGRAESRVMPNLDAVIATLGTICGIPAEHLPPRPLPRAFNRGERLLRYHTEAVFGPRGTGRRVRVMVTLPTEAAYEPQLVGQWIERGMDCARINCAHDSPVEWERMIGHVCGAARAAGRKIPVFMDIAGPKARTGEVLLPDPEMRLAVGDRVLLRRPGIARSDRTTIQAECTLPEVLDQLSVGNYVLFDDGKWQAQIEEIVFEGVLLQVTQTPPKGAKLTPAKGLNFVGAPIRLDPLTDKDRSDLDFVVAHADAVCYSFVQEAADVIHLQDEMHGRLGTRACPTLVVKIETARAVSNLPDMIVAAAGRQPFAVMIARGDLAVEIGFERLAEIQEELLWLCEAANVPVIWATQVLDRFVKKGIPSRAEITDAAMAERAECVMLNKGPFIAQAITILDDVLSRMQAHQLKKTPKLRALRSWHEVASVA